MTGQLPSVLFVTSELVGPFKNGGIGTATTGLVETVAGMGCKTTVFYTGGIWHHMDMTPWVEAYGRIGVDFVYVTPDDTHGLAGPVRERSVTVPFLVYRFVRERSFDVIHFNDTLGEGMHVLAAKRLGLGFESTLLALALHGPTRWAFGLNRQPMNRIIHAAFDWAEQVSVRNADLLWGPSRYLIDATLADGWALPEQVIQQQYVMPTGALFEPDPEKFSKADEVPPPRPAGAIEEIAFFGRLEERKGLRTFCAALDRLAPLLSQSGISVTFLGRAMEEDGESTADWIARAASDWPFPWRIEGGFGQREAIAYLTSRPLVAVMPSPYDNSPCTVYEAMQFGIPFIAAARGGIPELIADDDHASVLFEYTVEGLASALDRIVRQGVTTARPRFAPAERRRLWRDFHHRWRSFLPMPAVAPAVARPRLVVLVDRAGDRETTGRTLASVEAALGDRVAGIVVLARRPLGGLRGDPLVLDMSSLTGPDEGLRAALDRAAADWIFCIAAGAEILVDAVPALDRALASPAAGAGLIPAAVERGVRETRLVPPVGGAQAFGFLEGYGFTGGAIVSRAAAVAAIDSGPGLPRSAFAGIVDLIVCAGGIVLPFPEVLIDLPGPKLVAGPSFDPTRDRAFARMAPLQASMVRWIGAEAHHHPPITRYQALANAAGDGTVLGALMALAAALSKPLRPLARPAVIVWRRLRRVARPLTRFVSLAMQSTSRVLRRIEWYAKHPMSFVRLFDRIPGYAIGRYIYRAVRGTPAERTKP
jgi:glycosyltransferase involved in cell wall biosynthesis